MMDAIKLNQVDIIFRQRPLLTDVNMLISTGDLALLNGANGSGKSTLLKVISGLKQPSRGNVTIFDQKLKPGRFAKQTAILINAPQFIQNISGFDNLWALAQIKKRISAETVKTWMRRLGLDPESKLKIKRYSLGMTQKLGLIQALMENEKLILLDEPLNALDKKSKKDVIDLIQAIHETDPDKTWLIVSHDDSFEDIANRRFEINGEELTENV